MIKQLFVRVYNYYFFLILISKSRTSSHSTSPSAGSPYYSPRSSCCQTWFVSGTRSSQTRTASTSSSWSAVPCWCRSLPSFRSPAPKLVLIPPPCSPFFLSGFFSGDWYHIFCDKVLVAFWLMNQFSVEPGANRELAGISSWHHRVVSGGSSRAGEVYIQLHAEGLKYHSASTSFLYLSWFFCSEICVLLECFKF